MRILIEPKLEARSKLRLPLLTSERFPISGFPREARKGAGIVRPEAGSQDNADAPYKTALVCDHLLAAN